MRKPCRKVSNREGFLADPQYGYLNSSVFLRVLGDLRGEKRFCSSLFNTNSLLPNTLSRILFEYDVTRKDELFALARSAIPTSLQSRRLFAYDQHPADSLAGRSGGAISLGEFDRQADRPATAGS